MPTMRDTITSRSPAKGYAYPESHQRAMNMQMASFMLLCHAWTLFVFQSIVLLSSGCEQHISGNHEQRN